MKTPIKNSYWIIPNKFLAGEYPRNLDEESSIYKIKALINSGIHTFIDLTTKEDKLKPYDYLLKPYTSMNIHRINFPIPDVSVPSSKEQTIKILDTIKNCIKTDKTIYLHCWGGIGRTGLITGCWLAENGYSEEKAVTKLRELWMQCAKSAIKKTPETKAQENYIINWLKNK